VLAVLPNAAQVRKDLVAFYTRVGRFTDAAAAAREYVDRFPEDRAFPVSIAQLLTSRDRFADVITVLTPVAPRHDDAKVYMLLGYAQAMHGQRAEGLGYLERARKMQPDDWWPHYALGWAYGAGGDYRRAVASFEKAVGLRRGLADAERELRRLRPLVAGAPTS
jgi:Flp pilus assembly protein TadD